MGILGPAYTARSSQQDWDTREHAVGLWTTRDVLGHRVDMCLYLPAETAPRQTDRPVGRVERGYLVVEFLGTSCGSCNHSEAQTDLVVSWRFCCVIQKAWPRGKRVAGQMLGISALGMQVLVGAGLGVAVVQTAGLG